MSVPGADDEVVEVPVTVTRVEKVDWAGLEVLSVVIRVKMTAGVVFEPREEEAVICVVDGDEIIEVDGDEVIEVVVEKTENVEDALLSVIIEVG